MGFRFEVRASVMRALAFAIPLLIPTLAYAQTNVVQYSFQVQYELIRSSSDNYPELNGALFDVEIELDDDAQDLDDRVDFYRREQFQVRGWLDGTEVEIGGTNYLIFRDSKISNPSATANAVFVYFTFYLPTGEEVFVDARCLFDSTTFSFVSESEQPPVFEATAQLNGRDGRFDNYYIAPVGTISGVLLPKTTDSLIEELIAETDNINIANGIASSLDAKLDNAIDAYVSSADRGDVVNKLEAFKNSVEAQRGKKISDADADALILSSNIILRTL